MRRNSGDDTYVEVRATFKVFDGTSTSITSSGTVITALVKNVPGIQVHHITIYRILNLEWLKTLLSLGNESTAVEFENYSYVESGPTALTVTPTEILTAVTNSQIRNVQVSDCDWYYENIEILLKMFPTLNLPLPLSD